jgi:hypothetical protein
MAIVAVVIAASMREWLLVVLERKTASVTETPFVQSKLTI